MRERKVSKAELVHRIWVAEELNLSYSQTDYPLDVFDDHIGIRITRCLNRNKNTIFNIYTEKIEYLTSLNSGRELFHAFVIYGLVPDIIKPRKANSEDDISQRQVYFLDWDWIQDKPVSIYPHRGLRFYIKMDDLPDKNFFRSFVKGKNTLYVPPGSSLEKRIKPTQ